MADEEGQVRAGSRRTVWFAALAASVLAVAGTGWTLGAPAAGHLLAAVLAAAAGARAFLPPGTVGPLAVRTRTVDVVVTLSMAVLLVAVTQALPG